MHAIQAIARSEFGVFVKNTLRACNKDRVPRLGASLAFYSVLSLAPTVVVTLAVAGAFFGRRAAEGQLAWQIQNLIGPQGARAIQTIIDDAHHPVTGVTAGIIALVSLFFGATAVFNELRDALNTIWRVPAPEHESGWHSVLAEVRNRLVSFLVVLGVGLFVLASLAVNATVAAAGSRFVWLLAVPPGLVQFADSLLSFAVIAFVFAALYKVVPNVPVEWGDVAVGSLVTSALFTIGKFLISMYLGRTTVASAYGAAGSLVVLLLWVYYSAQVFFVGAEFTYQYTCRFGSRFRRKLDPTVPPEPEPSAPPAEPGIILVEHAKSEKA
jgi:membrane protein